MRRVLERLEVALEGALEVVPSFGGVRCRLGCGSTLTLFKLLLVVLDDLSDFCPFLFFPDFIE